MCFWAIVGPFCLLVRVVSLYVDLPDWLSFPRWELSPFIVFGVVGVIFVWLRLRGYIKFGGQ
jgi:hypothetical protein